MASVRDLLTAGVEKSGVSDDAPTKESGGNAEPKVYGGGVPVNGATGKELGKIEQKPAPKDTEKAAKAAQEQNAESKEQARGSDGKFVSRKMPSAWKKEFAPLWDKPGGHTADEWGQFQAEIERRETEAAKNAQGLNDRLKGIEPHWNAMQQVFHPYQDLFARRGLQAPQVMQQLLALASQAENDWPSFVREQSRLRGFDLAQFVASDTGQSEIDPAISALQKELQALKGQLTQRQQFEAQQSQQSAASQVATFQGATNSDGTPKHPHFERVRRTMHGLMTVNPELGLEQAYDQACNADPEIRETLIAEELTRREAKRVEELKRAADAAKSSSGNASGQSVGTLPKGSTVRAHLIQAMERLNGGARIN